MTRADRSHHILLLTPTGQDARLAAAVLADARIATLAADDIVDVCARLEKSSYGCVLLAEEALGGKSSEQLLDVMRRQAPWSDLPIIVLTSAGDGNARSAAVLAALTREANVTLLERPFRAATLVASVQSALRARKRQYEVRQLLEEQVSALRQKDDFISIASHELKTPLTSISLQTYINKRTLAAGGMPAREWMVKLVDTTERQVERLVRLVDDMLDISRINAGRIQIKKEPVDLTQLVRTEVERLAPQLVAADCVVTIDAPAATVSRCDAARMEQVIGNLLTNAIRYAPGKPIAISVGAVNNQAVVCIRDQGEGIAPADHERIFARFERADSAVAGLGLGLYICRELVGLHGGTIGVESARGQGAAFTVRLPLAD